MFFDPQLLGRVLNVTEHCTGGDEFYGAIGSIWNMKAVDKYF